MSRSRAVTKLGFGGATITYHPTHDMGSLFCFACGAWGWDEWRARRRCPGEEPPPPSFEEVMAEKLRQQYPAVVEYIEAQARSPR